MINPFAEVLDYQHDMNKKDSLKYESKIIIGYVVSLNPLSVRLEDGVELLPSKMFQFSEFVQSKPISCQAEHDGVFTGNFQGTFTGSISGNVSIQGTNSITGSISGNITLNGNLNGELTGNMVGTYTTSALWGGLQVDDKLLITTGNANQRYLIHAVLNRKIR